MLHAIVGSGLFIGACVSELVLMVKFPPPNRPYTPGSIFLAASTIMFTLMVLGE